MEQEKNQRSGYGERPMWQWILVCVVVAVIMYGFVYYFVLAKKDEYTLTSNQTYPTTTESSTPTSIPKIKSSTPTNISEIYDSGVDTKCELTSSGFTVTYYISKNAIRVQEKTSTAEVNMLGTKKDFYTWTSVSKTVAHMTGQTAEAQFGVLLQVLLTNGLICKQQSIPSSVFVPPQG